MSIFNALNVGYSGLKTSQIAIDTTGHNIANAENPAFTRQRAVIAPNTPLHTTPGDLGLGAKISEIVRIHDEFVYKRLKDASNTDEFNSLRKDTLDEISNYFPEIDKNGIYNGMQEYFNAWNDFSKNTDSGALKINLAQATRNFTATIHQTRSQITAVQKSLDEQLQTAVQEINRIGKQIAELNVKINVDEATGDHANDLRDQRDKLELALSKLVDIAVSKGDMKPDMTVDDRLVESGSAYHLAIGGASFVDGKSFHPLVFERPKGQRFGNVYYERQDGVKFDLNQYLHGGQVGAILSLRDGEIQKVVDDLDSFAQAMIVNTNNIYAGHATTAMTGNVKVDGNNPIGNSDLPIQDGSFIVKIYDVDGNMVAQRPIEVTQDKTFDDIVNEINKDNDDNADGVTNNDVDDFVTASIDARGHFTITMDSAQKDKGYTFALEESDFKNPTRFAGLLGLERFYDGQNAKDITLNHDLDLNPTKIGGNAAPIAGDNTLANRMIQLQYDKVDFYNPYDSKKLVTDDTLSGFFRMSTTKVADTTAAAHSASDTSSALLSAVVNQFDSISKVDIDEELTNLMKFQTGYSASAKVITAVDQMIQTLLGIKQ